MTDTAIGTSQPTALNNLLILGQWTNKEAFSLLTVLSGKCTAHLLGVHPGWALSVGIKERDMKLNTYCPHTEPRLRTSKKLLMVNLYFIFLLTFSLYNFIHKSVSIITLKLYLFVTASDVRLDYK